MASTFSPNLNLELIGTGDQAGSWGDTTNFNWGEIEEAVSGYVNVAVTTGNTTTITIPNGPSSGTAVARNMYLVLTGTGGTNTYVHVPTNKKLYFVHNTSSGAVTVRVSGQTGVSVPSAAKYILVCNGIDIVDAVSYITGTGNSGYVPKFSSTAAISNSYIYDNSSVIAGTRVGIGTSLPGYALHVSTSVGDGIVYTESSAFGSEAGFRMLDEYGDAAFFTVVSGGAYLGSASTAPLYIRTNNTTRMTINTSGNVGIGTLSPTSKLTLLGDASTFCLTTPNIVETATVSNTAAASTINYDLTTQSVVYYQANATSNWTMNFRITTIGASLSTGQAVTVVFMATQGTTAYYNTTVQIDGTTSGVTTKWQNGSAPTSGNPSGIDIYTYSIIKTASTTFTVLASQTQFK